MSLLFTFALSGWAATGCLLPPVEAPVVDPFRQPPCVWCPGNRGIEYGPTAGLDVRAAAAGTVTFTGDVAGTVYVVIAHADGTRTTYGNLTRSVVQRGAVVELAEVIAVAGNTLHFGWRDASDRYLDPTPLLGSLRVLPYLVPTDGTAPRQADRTGVCAR